MKVQAVGAVFCLAAAAAFGSWACEDEEDPPSGIDVSRVDAGAGGTGGPGDDGEQDGDSLCELAADQMLELCATSACQGLSGGDCRSQLVTACERDLAEADGIFKYMCRLNARECSQAHACTI